MNKKSRISRILSLALIFMMAFSFLPTGLQPAEVQAAGGWESEPNNSITTADLITLNEYWYGSTSNSRYYEVDCYKFTLNNPGYISVSFQHNYVQNGCWYVEIIDKDQNTELVDIQFDGEMDYETKSLNIGLDKGTYYLKISSNDNASNITYKFKVNYKKSAFWEKELNENIGTADKISLNEYWYGSTRRDYYWERDCYKFTLNKPGYISVSFQHAYTENGYWYVDIIDKDQNTELVEIQFNGEMDYETKSSNIGLPAGTYYLKITSNQEAMGTTYKFKVNYKQTDYWEKELNENIATATPIKTDIKWYGSTRRDYYWEKDYYKFTLQKKATVSVTFGHKTVDGSWDMEIIDKDQNTTLLEQRIYGGIASSTTNKLGLGPGTYYIRITADSDAVGVDYNFTVNTKTSISSATVSNIQNKTYTGKAITQNPTVKLAGKTLKNGTDYTLSYKNNVKVGTATVTITGKGNYNGSISKTFKINPAPTSLKAKSITVGSVSNKTWTGSPIKPKVTVKNGSTTLKEGTDYTLSYKSNTAVGTATITIKGKGKYKDTITKTFKIVAPAKQIERVEGRNRYLTATAIADELKAANGNKKFPAIIVATGSSHPDALAGGYLAKAKNAPIILTSPSIEADTIRYIKNNLAPKGKVYILGGEKAVPNSFVTKLRSAGINNYKRLGGGNRFDTNLLILNEAGVKKGQEIVVAKGYGSGPTDAQDALLAGATGRPMLLVNQSELTPSQRNFLNNKRPKTMTIIGSTGTVPSKIERQLSSYGTTSRIAGTNIYDRSVRVAEKYYKAPKCIVLAIGDNWPDALTGGPLAVKKGGPLLLTGTAYNQYKYAKTYVKKANIYKNYTLGGTAAVPETTTREIMKR